MRIAILVAMLSILLRSPSAPEAGSVRLEWTPPTTSFNGAPITDLAAYRVYVGTGEAPCPETPYRSFASATSSPTAGQVVTYHVTGLHGGASYAFRVTAVDESGDESGCSNSASGIAAFDTTVTPTTGLAFGSTATGTSVDRTLTVQNVGTATSTGTATVALPFRIVSGASFTLAPGASQPVVVRFSPTSVATIATSMHVSAGGDTFMRGVTGTGTAPPAATLTVTRSGTGSGAVTSAPAGIACGTTCSATFPAETSVTLTQAAAVGSVFGGWTGACTGTGACVVSLSAATSVGATFTLKNPVPVATSLSPSSVMAGSGQTTLTVNGSAFVSSSIVRWNGAPRATTFVSGTQLRATILPSDLSTRGTAQVTVFTGTPGGGTAAALPFTIAQAASGIVIDNAPVGVQDAAGGRTFTGSWCRATAPNPYGADSLVSCGTGGTDTYRWTPNLPATGTYDVYVWYTASTARSMNVAYTVVHANGATTRTFNQQTGGGAWVLHGRYTFNAGTAGSVRVNDANGRAGADAARFVPVTSTAQTIIQMAARRLASRALTARVASRPAPLR